MYLMREGALIEGRWRSLNSYGCRHPGATGLALRINVFAGREREKERGVIIYLKRVAGAIAEVGQQIEIAPKNQLYGASPLSCSISTGLPRKE